MDKDTRNKIRKMVQDARKALEKEMRELLEGVFGLHKDGTIEDISRLPEIRNNNDAIKARDGFAYFIERELSAGSTETLEKFHQIARAFPKLDATQAVDKLVLSLSFTHLNRLVALKLMERRRAIPETVSRGAKSNGFLHYVVRVLEKTELYQVENIDEAYKGFILYQCREVAEEIKVLFDPEDLSSYVFPRPGAIKEVLEIINNSELDDIWDQDETIGWFYQYFTPKEIREQVRAESSAPRNSWELAFRNQFYTPRYVVQFLADNTLGRTWYEMMQGKTKIAEFCQYMVKPKKEVFLQKDEKASTQEDTFQVPFREKKDPRELKILDPACGSGHFLLYVFDLLTIIYREAYDDKDLGIALHKDYPNKDSYEREIPRLILENNLYGIDIDLRAIQISAIALWLRAQKAWNDMGIHRDDRPKVTKAHLVCAEPMPGNKELFHEFVTTLQPALLQDLVRDVWERMELAGEAGSLLQIEQDLRDSVRKAKAAWSKRGPIQLMLDGKPIPQQLGLDLSGIKDEVFFMEAEDRVFSALRNYAEKAIVGDHGYHRRLFAEESIRGFQFIEVMQKRFDVVLMNPPFGSASLPSKEYIDKTYPRTRNDVYAAFVERMLQLLHERGFIGIISSRTGFFLSSFTQWREEILMKEASLHSVADFGFGVLEAMVETAAYTIEKTPATGRKAIFFRLLKDDLDAKGEELLDAIQNSDSNKCFEVKLDSFSLVPNTPFSYWVSDRIRMKFKEFPPFEGNGGTVKQGLATADDFRFIRANWEVKPKDINAITWAKWLSVKEGSISEQQNIFVKQTTNKRWVNFAKGGEYSPYYADIHLVVNWKKEGKELHAFGGSVIRNPDYYFRQGLTYIARTQKTFCAKPLFAGSIFGHVGPAIFIKSPKKSILIFNSSAFEFFMQLLNSRGMGETGASKAYEVGHVQRMPFADIVEVQQSFLDSIFTLCQLPFSVDETTHIFLLPSLKIYINSIEKEFKVAAKQFESKEISNSLEIHNLQRRIDKTIYDLYNIHLDDRPIIEEESKQTTKIENEIENELDEDETEEKAISESIVNRIQNLLMWCIGIAYGRWDIRMALDKSLIPKLADPFDPLPACSPGMLLSSDGYPATSGRIVSEEWLRSRVNVLDVPANIPNSTIPDEEYPIAIDWDGILVDDEGHSDDIIKKVREVMALIYGDKADEREKEMLEILYSEHPQRPQGAILRDYFRQPRQFFDFHIKRYSKSRRKAPIYWLLQTGKKNYSVWLYYHRLDGDTLYKVVKNYVEPKLNLISSQIAEMTVKIDSLEGKDKLNCEKELEKLGELRQEISDFKEKLERVIQMGYDPNFDDGVILNMAPLYEVIPWNEPAKYWKELQAGKYDWAHIAMKYWPERVKEKCKKDKSLAIAHGFE